MMMMKKHLVCKTYYRQLKQKSKQKGKFVHIIGLNVSYEKKEDK